MRFYVARDIAQDVDTLTRQVGQDESKTASVRYREAPARHVSTERPVVSQVERDAARQQTPARVPNRDVGMSQRRDQERGRDGGMER